ncbi:MAG TPA: hypothetical protein VJM07_13360 [Gaiella sp.]|jgi:hypothetical protein|nr:hypothetical protein [Gaiella sp.]
MHYQRKRGKYIGRASRRVSGDDVSLEEAIKDAYDRAKNSKPDDERTTLNGALTLRFQVVGIEIEGNNPISDYIVHLDDA